MPRTMPIMEARKRLCSLPEEIERDPEKETVAVTRRGKPVLAVMQWDLYESIIETLEVMGDPKLMAAIRRGIREMEAGESYSIEEVNQRLGL